MDTSALDTYALETHIFIMYFGKPIIEASKKHPKPEGVNYSYGTAGFRCKADILDPVLFRVGLLATVRSAYKKGQTIGIMITASHNPAADNGVKLVDPYGEMLEQSWESYATELANADESELPNIIYSIIKNEDIDFAGNTVKTVIARDTRPSGENLAIAVQDGINCMGAKYLDLGIQTTPILHYVTRCLNTLDQPDKFYGEPTPEGYYKKLAEAFNRATNGKSKLSTLTIDCANGVGAVSARNFAKALGTEHIDFVVANDAIDKADKLNYECGADFVKVNVKIPKGIDAKVGGRYASLDGDADRVVFWYLNDKSEFKLLDGDKIAILAAEFLGKYIKAANIKDVKVGLVQTAYANGNSTRYVKEKLGLEVDCTPTGVKHLHHAAEKFDIGVYFEANGHGTILFSDKAQNAIKNAPKGVSEESDYAIEVLKAFVNLVNQTVGDALSDLLAVEAILVIEGKSFSEWDSSYTDLASKLEKVSVKNRLDFVAVNAERQLEKPEGAQDLINTIVSKFKNGRSFVRPSGTEDVVRVYAEAEEGADELAYAVCGLVYDKYGGSGERNSKFLDYKKYL